MEKLNQLELQESEQIFKLPNSWKEKGLREGMKEGLQEGRMTEKRKIACEMLNEKLPIDLIARVTGLEVEEIKTLNND